VADTDQVAEQEIKHEQTVVDRVYARLEEAAKSAHRLRADGYRRATLGNEGGLVERDALVYQAAKRIASLDAAHEGLVFGRLDTRTGDARYIGRIGLRDAEREVLLIDWRAPVAAVFYQATAAEPMDVVRRRVLRSIAERVTGVEDELLDAAHAPADMVIVGEGALLASLTRARDAHMHTIVATIQKEQDDAIRSPHQGVTTITGGPGTGKTVVALHRAAYLLYTDRHRFERGGVLVVGPSAVFMSYIERVLPSLGETAVSLRALGEIVDGLTAVRHDPPAVARIKGSARMRRLLSRVARAATPDAPTELRLFYRDDVLVLGEHDLRAARRDLFASGMRRNQVAPRVADVLIGRLWEQVTGQRAAERGKDEFAFTMLGTRQFTDFVGAWWPVVGATDVYSWMRDRRFVRDQAGDLLSPDELDTFLGSLGTADAADSDRGLSVEDIPLVDELRYLLGDPPEPDPDEIDPLADLVDDLVPEVTTGYQRTQPPGTGRPSQSIEEDGYAHVLIDEGQDLSPMQWRMVGRRGRAASWTIVGDPAQSSWPDPDEAAAARAEALRGKDERSFRLSTNYRNSLEIFDLAGSVARAGIPGADLPEAVRATGVHPVVAEVTPTEVTAAVRQAVLRVMDAVDGTVGVVGSHRRLRELMSWLDDLESDGRVRVVEPLDTKGLEFDGVVVVEPDQIVDESPTGVRLLYVVLTRATQRLEIVGTSSRWRP
jgi:DNA helicase IV